MADMSQMNILNAAGHAFRELAKDAGLDAQTFDGQKYQLAALRDAAVFHFALPRRSGFVEVDGKLITAARTRGTLLIDHLALELKHAARELRGAELLDILNGNDWAPPENADIERLERASVLLMEHVAEMQKAMQ